MTQFKFDNKEATVSILFMYIVTLSVVCTLKGYNTKIKAMCEIMSKGSKEALTVSIVTYVQPLKSFGKLRLMSDLLMLKVSKVAQYTL